MLSFLNGFIKPFKIYPSFYQFCEKPLPIIAEIYRNDILESQHHGHAVVMHAGGDVLFELGDSGRQIFPRSSCKMIQALPLIESGAADDHKLNSQHLALACASHMGEEMHVMRVRAWLDALELSERDLRCGPQEPKLISDRFHIHDNGQICSRAHNNCSGKHTGFLTLNQKLRGDSEYQELDHPVQLAVKAAFEELAEEESAGYGIDGCGAPNFTTSIRGLARASANFSKGLQAGGKRGEAFERLTHAMMAHPLLVEGTGSACSELMAAASGRAALKFGAEGVYVGILPEAQIGIAIKAEDGSARAVECAISAILVRLGVVDQGHPSVKKFLNPSLFNFNQTVVGYIRPSAELWQGGTAI